VETAGEGELQVSIVSTIVEVKFSRSETMSEWASEEDGVSTRSTRKRVERRREAEMCSAFAKSDRKWQNCGSGSGVCAVNGGRTRTTSDQSFLVSVTCVGRPVSIRSVAESRAKHS
jgi:hypothetical protein